VPDAPARRVARIEQSFFVARPPEAVFDYLVDPCKLAGWHNDGSTLEVLTEGPTRQGTQVRQSGKALGLIALAQVSEVTEFDRPRRFRTEVVEGPMLPLQDSYTLRAEGDGTRVTVSIVYGLKRMQHISNVLTKPILKRKLAAAYRRLTEILEADPRAASSQH
jgi:hypothetical protein